MLQVNGRMLLALAHESCEEWGYGGSLSHEPGADDRSLRMRLEFDAGATPSGVQSLWALVNAMGLMRQGGIPLVRRSDDEFGFGLGGGLLWYPYLAADCHWQKALWPQAQLPPVAPRRPGIRPNGRRNPVGEGRPGAARGHPLLGPVDTSRAPSCRAPLSPASAGHDERARGPSFQSAHSGWTIPNRPCPGRPPGRAPDP